MTETVQCPVCAKAACKLHVRACDWCGRTICFSDFKSMRSNCQTCSQLAEVAGPSEELTAAVMKALDSEQRPSHWKMARDATHTVVEAHLGWTRRVVLFVRHSDNVAEIGKVHSGINGKKFRRSA